MKFNFMVRRKIWYLISLAIIIPGIISLSTQGLNLGIDFRGGAIMELEFERTVQVEEVRGVLDELGLGEGAQVQSAGEKEIFIRMEPLGEVERNELRAAMEENIGAAEIVREEMVGPRIGQELTIKALLSLGLASILMIVYVTWRFELRSGIATVIGLMHDVLIALSIFSMLQIAVDAAFVAAVLTIVGYSINNTIVIFDRIRENINEKKYNESLEDVVNKSIWQSMSRSINTALTVLFVLVAMFLFGGDATKPFILAIILGVSAGVYSSMLISSPLWLEMKLREPEQEPDNY